MKDNKLKPEKSLPAGLTIGSFLTVIWWLISGIYYHSVINSYKSTDLPNALLTIFSVFFGAIIIMISILISAGISKNQVNPPNTHNGKLLIDRFRKISIAISILLLFNVLSYFSSGYIQIIAIYYQVWTAPALMLLFYNTVRFITP